jgi:hypothetical protein
MEKTKAKRKPRARKPRQKSTRTKNPSPSLKAAPEALPEPIPENQQSEPEKTEKRNPFLEGLGNVFSTNPKAENQPSEHADSLSNSGASEAPGTAAETEQVLRAVPDVIGDVQGADAQPGEPDVPGFALPAVIVDESNVRAMLEEFHDWLAAFFESDHWKLTARQSQMLGGPFAGAINSLWAKVKPMLPAMLSGWAESNPSLIGAALVASMVYGPMAATQWKLSRERKTIPIQAKKSAGRVSPGTSTNGNTGIPTATGVIGDMAA